MAEITVLDSILVAIALTDEVQGNLHLLCESQRLYLDGLRLSLLWTAFRFHADAERHLGN